MIFPKNEMLSRLGRCFILAAAKANLPLMKPLPRRAPKRERKMRREKGTERGREEREEANVRTSTCMVLVYMV